MVVSGRIIQGIDVSWAKTRELFSLDPAVAHLNNGSFGAVPIPVQRAQQRLRDEMDANPMAFFSRGLIDRLAHTRRHLAAFLGANPEGTALVPNVTTAAQIALDSLHLGSGDEIVLTDHGYGTVRLAAERACASTGATINEVSLPLQANDEEIIAAIAQAVRPGRTRLTVVDHITSPTAKLLPVDRIVAALREREVPVLVDAAHAPGMLPVDVGATNADFWLGNLHKWAFAPRPTAVLAVAAERRRSVRPLVVSWEFPAGYPSAVEFAGTLDYTAWLAAPTGIHLLRTLGLAQVRAHNADLARYGQRVVAAAVGLDEAQLPGADEALVSMRLVPLPAGVADTRPDAVALRSRIAAELACEVALDAWHGRGFLRLSAQIYNRPDEYDRLAQALPGLLRRRAA